MKKTYFTPEIDIVKFSLTDLIMGPSINEGANVTLVVTLEAPMISAAQRQWIKY